MQVREGDKATIIQHCAVFGHMKKEVRKFSVEEPAKYAQHPVAVRVSFTEPRKRTWYSYKIVPDNIRYLTIEVKGETVYDSRHEVPCDMEAWRAGYEKHRARWLEEKAKNDEAMARNPGMTITMMGNFEE